MKNKKLGPTETRTRIKRFRVFCANHYTIEPSYYFVYIFFKNIIIITLYKNIFSYKFKLNIKL